MTLWCVIPAKPFQEAKSRLAPDLSPAARQNLAAALFRRTCRIVCDFAGARPVLVVTRSPEIEALAQGFGALALHEGDSPDVNAALTTAALHATRHGASSVLAISADLPLLESGDLAALTADLAVPAIAPDRHGTGGNALLWHGTRPAPYMFGPHSLSRHLSAMAALGARPHLIHREGLAVDIDDISDLHHAQSIRRHVPGQIPYL
jgi:2-phospho-L-lactate guanylyltransferase